MPVLERPVLRKDWLEEVVARNGIVKKAPSEHAGDAGPWESAVQKVIGFQQLQDDWDGFGAQAPSRELLESAIGLAYCFLENGVDPPHRVAPGVGGEVVFEWQDPDGTYTEVEIDAPHAAVMMIEPGKPARHWTLPTPDRLATARDGQTDHGRVLSRPRRGLSH
jgi:hypothetical protein